MLPNVSGLRLDGPPSVGTGEFYALSQPEVDALNAGGGKEAFTVEPFQQDVEPVEGWHAFRVRAEHPRPDGTYDYQYYRAESLWRWVKDGNRIDPITRGPIWYEDYVELHNRFAPGTPLPPTATLFRRKDAPVPPAAPAGPPPSVPPIPWEVTVPYADAEPLPVVRQPNVREPLFDDEDPDFDRESRFVDLSARGEDMGDELLRDVWFSARRVFRDQDSMTEQLIELNSALSRLLNNWERLGINAMSAALLQAVAVCQDVLTFPSGWTGNWLLLKGKVIDFFLRAMNADPDLINFLNRRPDNARAVERWIARTAAEGMPTGHGEALIRRLEYAAMPSGVPPSQRRRADWAANSPQRSRDMTAGTNVHDSSWGSNRTPPRSPRMAVVPEDDEPSRTSNRMPPRLGPRTRRQRNRANSLSRAAAVPAQNSDFDEEL